jgi:peptidoglycan/LPS O-acetylase OafA/YrhL
MTARQHAQARDFPWFDWLRIALALVVVLKHSDLIAYPMAGNLAVQVFFSLSGWLIGGILFRSTREHLPRFYFNRATRIWIPYGFAMLLLFAASTLHDVVNWRWAEFLFYDLTFTHNWFAVPQLALHQQEMPLQGTANHFWSISAEEQFYLLAPILILLLHRGRNLALWCVIAAVSWLTGQYSAIALGVLAALLEHRHPGWYRQARARIAIWSIVIASAGLIAMFPAGYVWITPVFSVAVVLASAVPGRRTRAGEFFGGVSYPLYLNHWIGVFIVHAVAKKLGWAATPSVEWAGVAINLIVASVFFLLIDRNIHKYRETWFTRRRGAVLAVIGYGLVVSGGIVGIALAVARA